MNNNWQLLLLKAFQINIKPTEFWQLTLPELIILITNDHGSDITNNDLKMMQQKFPDKL